MVLALTVKGLGLKSQMSPFVTSGGLIGGIWNICGSMKAISLHLSAVKSLEDTLQHTQSYIPGIHTWTIVLKNTEIERIIIWIKTRGNRNKKLFLCVCKYMYVFVYLCQNLACNLRPSSEYIDRELSLDMSLILFELLFQSQQKNLLHESMRSRIFEKAGLDIFC